MDAFLFIGFIIVVIGGTLAGALYLTRPKPGQPKMVILGVAGGREEAQLWADRLSMVRIKTHVRNVGDTMQSTSPYAYEVWVRTGDLKRARQILGL